MKISGKFYLVLVLLVVTVLMLGACGDSPSTPTSAPAPAKTTTSATTSPPVTTVAPSPTTVAATTAPSTTVAATTAPAATATVATTLPKTTTVAATTAAVGGNNTVSGLGVTMSFPTGWSTNVQDKDNEGVLSGTNPDGSYITIYRFTKGDAVKGDLSTRASNLLDNLKTSFSDLTVMEQPTQISGDTVRFGIQFTSKDSGKLNTEIVLVIDDAALKGTYLVEAGAEKSKFNDKTRDSLVSILNTIKTNPAAVKSQSTPVVSSKDNLVKGLGINLTFPAEWQTQVNEKTGEGSILSVSPQGSYINIFRFTKGSVVEGNLKQRAGAVVDYLKSLYPDLKLIEEPNEVTADTARFSVQYTDPTRKTSNIEVVLVIDDATLKATYLVEAGADKSKFEGQQDMLVNILSTLKTS